jgi:hypothetical protein
VTNTSEPSSEPNPLACVSDKALMQELGRRRAALGLKGEIPLRFIQEIPGDELAVELLKRYDSGVVWVKRWNTKDRDWESIMRLSGNWSEILGACEHIKLNVNLDAMNDAIKGDDSDNEEEEEANA